MEQSQRYKVTYTIADDAKEYVTTCVIIPGYTTVDDIPQIIAVSRTGRQADRVFINVKHKELLPDSHGS
ncbi:hypothetical protein GCM10010149_88320 [Nonomuraea roseoviolacea subsp. roseoviolacea]